MGKGDLACMELVMWRGEALRWHGKAVRCKEKWI